MDLSNYVIGMEFGSTRIKAVLLDKDHVPVASGAFEWENSLVDGIWTYPLEEAVAGAQACFAALKLDTKEKLGVNLTKVGAIGISGMMHGYLPFDKDGKQLAGFRTWRNTMTGEAAGKLSELFGFAIPQRWSIAHLYQAMLNEESHVKDIAFLTTLAGYFQWQLTGEKVMGIGESSGMFPIDSSINNYNETMLDQFDALHDNPWKIREILPKVLVAGETAGVLTKEGALLLDPTGELEAGIPLAPCEGDGGTGMAATNSVRKGTGNVSAGTSDFAMVVLEEATESVVRNASLNMVTTPSGAPVAMVHCTNCTSDINAWVNLFGEFAETMGMTIDKGTLFTTLFRKALEGSKDCGGLLSYNYYSGEGVTKIDAGRPVFLRTPDASLNLADFMRTHLYSALSTLKIGLDILTKDEGVEIKQLYGHGGFFKTPEVGQRILSAAVGAPVSVMETAGEGGPYGMALLAAYMLHKEEGETLEDYLDKKVFASAHSTTLMAEKEEIEGFDRFLEKYKKAFGVEREAVSQY